MKDPLIRSSRPGSDANERFNELRNGDRYPRVTGKINGTNGTKWDGQQNASIMSDVVLRPSRRC